MVSTTARRREADGSADTTRRNMSSALLPEDEVPCHVHSTPTRSAPTRRALMRAIAVGNSGAGVGAGADGGAAGASAPIGLNSIAARGFGAGLVVGGSSS